jgi:hypothetical protein
MGSPPKRERWVGTRPRGFRSFRCARNPRSLVDAETDRPNLRNHDLLDENALIISAQLEIFPSRHEQDALSGNYARYFSSRDCVVYDLPARWW